MLYYLGMPLSPISAKPLAAETNTETLVAPVETPVVEAAPTVETAPATGPDVYVEGEPLPPGVLASPEQTPEPAAASAKREIAPPAPIPEDPAQKAIEQKLETGVGAGAFASLEPLAQEAFRVRGEQTAITIRALLTAPNMDAKVVKGLSDTIHAWLALVPGVNPAWLEQATWATVGNLMELRES